MCIRDRAGPGGVLPLNSEALAIQKIAHEEDGLEEESDEEYAPQTGLADLAQALPGSGSGSDRDRGSWNEPACRRIVDRINAGRETPIVHLIVVKELPSLSERLALFAAADVLLQTPLREGISLFPFEFCLASAWTHGFRSERSSSLEGGGGDVVAPSLGASEAWAGGSRLGSGRAYSSAPASSTPSVASGPAASQARPSSAFPDPLGLIPPSSTTTDAASVLGPTHGAQYASAGTAPLSVPPPSLRSTLVRQPTMLEPVPVPGAGAGPGSSSSAPGALPTTLDETAAFVASRPRATDPVPVMVLSEFAANVEILTGAIRANPWQVDTIVQALQMALEMGHEERAARFLSDLRVVQTRTATAWAHSVLTAIKRCSPLPQDGVGGGGKGTKVGLGLN